MSLSTLLLLSAALVRGLKTNRTVDDEQGDSESGVLPSYLPSANVWSQGALCHGCGVNLDNIDLEQVHDGTWHDGTYRPGGEPLTVTVTFAGTAVYVYNILANDILPTITFTNISFYLDGGYVGQFIHAPDDSSTLQYDVLVFHDSNLTNAPHTLLMSASGADISLILFDYLVYTVDDSSPPNMSSSMTMSSTTPAASTRTPLLASTSHEKVGTVTAMTSSTSLTSLSITTDSSAALTPPSTPLIPPSDPSKDSATTILISSSTSTFGPTSSPTTHTDSSLSAGPAAGIAIGCIGVFVLVCTVFWLRRRLRRHHAQKIRPSSSGDLLDGDFEGLPSGGLNDTRSPCGEISRLRYPSQTMLSHSTDAFATLGASVDERSSDCTLVMRDTNVEGKKYGRGIPGSDPRLPWSTRR